MARRHALSEVEAQGRNWIMAAKYRAFISYSHTDKRWAEWLHRALESYRVPSAYVGMRNEVGERIEAKLGTFFRDRDELRSGPDLADAIRLALDASENLIVVCSPSAAQSHYVNQEIIEFKRSGRKEKIHGLIVKGEPGVGTAKGEELLECFPLALRFELDEQGNLSNRLAAEVVAADARGGRDGKNRALIKLIAGLLHVDFDGLYQRERKRYRRRAIVASLTAITTVVLLVGFGFTAIERSREATQKERMSETRRLSRESDGALKEDPPRSILLAAAAARLWKDAAEQTPVVAQQALRNALEASGGWGLNGHTPIATGPMSGPATILLNAIGFSSDSRRLITGGADGTIRIWDIGEESIAPSRVLALGEPVRAVALSQLGKHLAGFGTAGKGAFWNLADSSAQAIELLGHTGSVVVARFSPDLHWLATGSGDGTAILWPMAKNSLAPSSPKILNQHAPVVALAFARDEAWVATAGICERWIKDCDGGLTLWDLTETGGSVTGTRILRGVNVTSMDMTEDGHLLATASSDGVLRTWDASSLQAMRSPMSELTVEEPKGSEPVDLNLALAPHGGLIATASPKSGILLRRIRLPSEPPIVLRAPGEESTFALTFSHDGQQLAVGGDKPMLWHLSEGADASAEQIPGFAGLVLGIAFSADGRWLAAGGADAAVRVWDLRQSLSAKAIWSDIATAGKNLDRTAVSRLETFISARHSQRRTGREKAPLGNLQLGNGSAISGDGRRLATVNSAKDCQLWRMGDKGEREVPPVVFKPSCGDTRASTFSPDGRWLAAAGSDGMVHLWKLSNDDQASDYWELTLGLTRPNSSFGFTRASPLVKLAFSPDGRILAMANEQGIVGIADVSNAGPSKRSLLRAHQGEISTLAFSHDSQRLLTSGTDGFSRLWSMLESTSTPRLIREFSGHEGWVHSAALAPDGHWLAAGGGHIKQNGADTVRADSRVLLWDLQDSSRPAIPLVGHRGWVIHAAFSPDGTWLATAGEDGTRLWPVGADHPAESVLLHSGPVSALAFAPDGDWLVTLGSGGTLVWDLNVSELVARAQQVVGRNFAEDEWRRYFPNQRPEAVFPALPNPFPLALHASR
jgi:WD40 repeat protein